MSSFICWLDRKHLSNVTCITLNLTCFLDPWPSTTKYISPVKLSGNLAHGTNAFKPLDSYEWYWYTVLHQVYWERKHLTFLFATHLFTEQSAVVSSKTVKLVKNYSPLMRNFRWKVYKWSTTQKIKITQCKKSTGLQATKELLQSVM